MGNPQPKQHRQRPSNHSPIASIQLRQRRQQQPNRHILREVRVRPHSDVKRVDVLDGSIIAAEFSGCGDTAGVIGAAGVGLLTVAERAGGDLALANDAVREEEVVETEGEGVEGGGC